MTSTPLQDLSGAWGHVQRGGLHIGRATIGILTTREQAAKALSPLAEDLSKSDYMPMVELVAVRDMPQQACAALVIEIWSESDSATFLQTRMEHAIKDLAKRLASHVPGPAPTISANESRAKQQITKGIPETEQESGFMNATLQGAGEKIAFSIAASLTVPDDISSQGEDTVAAYIEGALSAASAAHPGLSFDVQIGPSREAETNAERHGG